VRSAVSEPNIERDRSCHDNHHPHRSAPNQASRARLVTSLNLQRNALVKLCGCPRCGDSDARTELQDRIHKNLTALDELNDLICERATSSAQAATAPH
jgi:hypothetical protein